MKQITIMEHPLIQHKISILRNEATGTNEFRRLIEEIAMLMGYEALRDLPVEDVEIKTPIETCRTSMIAGKKLAIVPILRAGLGMVSGILSLVPSAKVGHIGLYRDEETHEPHEYYCKLPEPIDAEVSSLTLSYPCCALSFLILFKLLASFAAARRSSIETAFNSFPCNIKPWILTADLFSLSNLILPSKIPANFVHRALSFASLIYFLL